MWQSEWASQYEQAGLDGRAVAGLEGLLRERGGLVGFGLLGPDLRTLVLMTKSEEVGRPKGLSELPGVHVRLWVTGAFEATAGPVDPRARVAPMVPGIEIGTAKHTHVGTLALRVRSTRPHEPGTMALGSAHVLASPLVGPTRSDIMRQPGRGMPGTAPVGELRRWDDLSKSAADGDAAVFEVDLARGLDGRVLGQHTVTGFVPRMELPTHDAVEMYGAVSGCQAGALSVFGASLTMDYDHHPVTLHDQVVAETLRCVRGDSGAPVLAAADHRFVGLVVGRSSEATMPGTIITPAYGLLRRLEVELA